MVHGRDPGLPILHVVADDLGGFGAVKYLGDDCGVTVGLGWFAGSASTWNIFAAGAAIGRETETCARPLRFMPFPSFSSSC
jgi:hypothetical protein